VTVTITEDMTDVSMCDSITGWAGGIEEFATESDIKVEGSYSLAAWIDQTTSAVEYYTISSTDLSDGEHVFVWMSCNGVVDTKANGGYRIVLYTDSSNYATFYVGGKDTHPNGGWVLLCTDASATPDDEVGTFDPSDVTRIGIQFKTLTDAPSVGQNKFVNCFWDAMRYGKGLIVTSASTDDADYQDIFDDELNDNYFGVVQKAYGAFIQSGQITLGGTSTETCDFVIDNEVIIFPDNDLVASDFYQIIPLGNATNPTYVIISNSVIKCAGSEKFTINASGANINTFTVISTTFDGGGDITFLTGQSITYNIFNACDAIDPNGSTFENNTISNSTVSGTSEGSLMVNVDTEGEACKDLTFSDYPGATTYAVYVAASVTEFDMDNWQFDDPNNTTSYAIYWASGSGTLTINALNGTNLVSAGCTSAGGTVTVVNAVTLQLTVKDPDGAAIVGARCFIEAGDDSGAAPFEDSVSITSTGGVATVTHSGHGLTTGQMVNIRGCIQPEYNGAGKVITFISSTQYSYTISGTPASPATGTPTSTQCFLSEVTITGGIASESFNASGTQTYRGKVRMASGSPFYADVNFNGSDCSSGLDLPIQMGLDQ